jgi:death-on-curing protein
MSVTELITTGRPDLVDSALRAPAAEFAEHEFYRDLIDKAAVLVSHLIWNHPLIDGNKRTAWAMLAVFARNNRLYWRTVHPDPEWAEGFTVTIADRWRQENLVCAALRRELRPLP